MTETITIERMGYGAEAVGHLPDGKTVFVEGGAPGDVASVEVVEDKPTFARARIAKLEQPGACRVMPKWAEPAASGAAPVSNKADARRGQQADPSAGHHGQEPPEGQKSMRP